MNVYAKVPVHCPVGMPVRKDGKQIGRVTSCRQDDAGFHVDIQLEENVQLDLASIPVSSIGWLRTEDNEHD